MLPTHQRKFLCASAQYIVSLGLLHDNLGTAKIAETLEKLRKSAQ